MFKDIETKKEMRKPISWKSGFCEYKFFNVSKFTELRILKQCFHQTELRFHPAFNYAILFLMEPAVRDICRNSTFSMNAQKKIHLKFNFFLSSNLTEKCTCIYKNFQQIIIQIMSSLNSTWPYKVIDTLTSFIDNLIL